MQSQFYSLNRFSRLNLIAYTILFAVTLWGCGESRPSLTRDELATQHPNEKYVQIDGVSLHYRQEGLGRPLVLLHGMLTSTQLWRNITPGLAFGHTIYSLDLMGFGLSEKPQDRSYNLDTYVAQLERFLEQFHLANPILVGHELGAVIAATYTLRHPNTVRKLILLNAPLSPEPLPWRWRLLQVPFLGELMTGDWILRRQLQSGVANPAVMTEALLETYLQPYHEDPGARAALPKALREVDLASLWEKELHPQLLTMQTPTLLVWGDSDPYAPLPVGRQLDQAIPHSDFVVVLKTGHYGMEERPEEVRAVIKEFLGK